VVGVVPSPVFVSPGLGVESAPELGVASASNLVLESPESLASFLSESSDDLP